MNAVPGSDRDVLFTRADAFSSCTARSLSRLLGRVGKGAAAVSLGPRYV
jgi:hypothetical protein